MKNIDLIVLFVIVVLLGIGTGFLNIDFENTRYYLISLIGILYKGSLGSPGDRGRGTS